MKKLLIITTLGLFCFGTAQATTLYCDYHQWNDYVVLNIDYKNNIVQGPTFKGGKKFKATITNKKIF